MLLFLILDGSLEDHLIAVHGHGILIITYFVLGGILITGYRIINIIGSYIINIGTKCILVNLTLTLINNTTVTEPRGSHIELSLSAFVL